MLMIIMPLMLIRALKASGCERNPPNSSTKPTRSFVSGGVHLTLKPVKP